METTQLKAAQNPPHRRGKNFVVAQILLRTLVIGATLIAAWLMFTSKQTMILFGVPIDAKFSYSPAFGFFAYVNVGACVLTLLSLISVSFDYYQGPFRGNYFYLFLHDLLMTAVVIAACGAATAIGYVGSHGNSHTGWMAICSQFGKFCKRVKLSIIFSYLAVVMFLILTVLSSRRVQGKAISGNV